MSKIKMQAPKGTTTANIEGHTYDIPKNGIITVLSENHVETLKRHGFTDATSETPEELEAIIDSWTKSDKADAVEFIEERGGEADDEMSIKKLKSLAREVAGLDAE